MHLPVVEDEPTLARYLRKGLEEAAWTVDVTHTAATPVGALAKATARYTGREGKLFAFEVVVEDPAGECMRGVHKRAVIDEKRLLEGARKRGLKKRHTPAFSNWC